MGVMLYCSVSTRVYFRMRSMHFHTLGWKNYTFLRPAMRSVAYFRRGSVRSITH